MFLRRFANHPITTQATIPAILLALKRNKGYLSSFGADTFAHRCLAFPRLPKASHLLTNGVQLMSVRFTQCCPTCGRRIQIQTTLLGRTVACQHCRAEFVAQLESEQELPSVKAQASQTESDPLMARVDALLAQSSQDAAVRS